VAFIGRPRSGPFSPAPPPFRRWQGRQSVANTCCPRRAAALGGSDGLTASCGQRWGSAWRLGVSSGNRSSREWIVGGLESLSEAGAKRAIVDGAPDLEQ